MYFANVFALHSTYLVITYLSALLGRHLYLTYVIRVQATDINCENEITIVELDEIHTYIGNKKYCWIWITVDRVGKKFIDCSFGSRGTET